MGPWVHGGWAGGRAMAIALGDVQFNAKTAEFFREKIELPFFEYHLKGKGEFKHPEAWVFETGTNRWRKHDAWPPKTAQAEIALLPRRPANFGWQPPTEAGRRPTTNTSATPPSRCPISTRSRIGMSTEYMVADQRFAARRPDVLVYETDVLTRRPDHRRADRRPSCTSRPRGTDSRLGRQADRRLSRRLSRPETEPDAGCRWAAISNWCAAT